MYLKNARKLVSLLLLAFSVISILLSENVQAQPYIIKSYGVCKELEYSKIGLGVKPRNITNIISLGDNEVYFWLELKEVYAGLNVIFTIYDPDGVKFLEEEVTLPSPLVAINDEKYNWVFIYIKVPVRSHKEGLMEIRTFPSFFSSKTLAVGRMKKKGNWTVSISINKSIVVKYNFTVRAVKTTFELVDYLGRPLPGSALIVLENSEQVEVHVEDGRGFTWLTPGRYLTNVYWDNLTVFRGSLLIEKDGKFKINCSVSYILIKILDNSSKPIKGAYVELIAEGFPYKLSRIQSNDEGVVQIDPIPHTRYLVKIYWRGREIYTGSLYAGKNYTILTPVYSYIVKVIGEQGQPIPGAKIFFHEANVTYITDKRGEALIKQFPRGDWIIKVSYRNIRATTLFSVPKEHVISINVFIEVFGIAISRETFIASILGVLLTLASLLIAILVYMKLREERWL